MLPKVCLNIYNNFVVELFIVVARPHIRGKGTLISQLRAKEAVSILHCSSIFLIISSCSCKFLRLQLLLFIDHIGLIVK